MDISINEMAYRGQFDKDSAKDVLKSHIENIEHCSWITGKKPISRTEGLKFRPLTQEMNIQQFCFSLGRSKVDKERVLNRLLLSKFVKGPYVKPALGLGVFYKSEDIENSALAYCLENLNVRGLVSPALEDFKGNIELYDAEKQLVASITNHSEPEVILNSVWRYEPNPKHDIPKDYIVDGNVWSKMDLDDKEAQELLSSGFKIEGRRCVFALKGEKWYQFYNHEANLYHGFPIKNPGNDKHLNQVEKFITENDGAFIGQTVI